MKYVRFTYYCGGYPGYKDEEYFEFEDGVFNDWDLDRMVSEGSDMHAEQYDHRFNFSTEKDFENYYKDARDRSYWEYITEEEYMENTYEK